MKRLCIAGMAVVATLVGFASPAAAHTKSFDTKITVTFTPGPMSNSVGTTGTFTGSIRAGGGCRSKRPIYVSSSRQDEGGYQTNSAGQFTTVQTDPGTQPKYYSYEDNPYRVSAGKHTIRKGDKHKHKCKPGLSPSVEVFAARGFPIP